MFRNARFWASDPARIGGAVVTFEAGARTAWQTRPLGQTLIGPDADEVDSEQY
jgi:hypothetical protein